MWAPDFGQARPTDQLTDRPVDERTAKTCQSGADPGALEGLTG